jgi:hypothetical protein
VRFSSDSFIPPRPLRAYPEKVDPMAAATPQVPERQRASSPQPSQMLNKCSLADRSCGTACFDHLSRRKNGEHGGHRASHQARARIGSATLNFLPASKSALQRCSPGKLLLDLRGPPSISVLKYKARRFGTSAALGGKRTGRRSVSGGDRLLHKLRNPQHAILKAISMPFAFRSCFE